MNEYGTATADFSPLVGAPWNTEVSLRPGPTDLRQVFSAVPTGVSVITTAGTDGPRGMTASTVCSLSLNPLLVLVCIDNRSETLQAILSNGSFAVNVLEEDQEAVSSTFACRLPPAEKFSAVSYRLINGSPVLDEALAWVTCALHSKAPGGDHTIVIGAVSATGVRSGKPLVRQAGRYRRLAPDAA